MNVETITIDGNRITAKELSVAQVRDILNNAEPKDGLSTVDIIFANDVPAIAIEKSTGITLDELENYMPSDVEKIIAIVRNTNPLFLKAVERLMAVGDKILQEKDSIKSSAE